VVLVAEGEGVAVGLDDGGLVAGGALDGDDLGLPVHAGHAGAVVPARGGGAGDVGAVERRGDVAVVVVGVPPVDVVDVAVPVVVDAVAGDLGGVRPEAEVGVAELEPVVDDGDGDAGAVGGDAAVGELPRLGGVDVGVGGAAGLAGVVEVPHLAEAGVVRRDAGAAEG